MQRQSLTGKQFWEYCNSDSNADELNSIFRKNFDDRVSPELANAVINILDAHEYSVYENKASDMAENAFERYDHDTKETTTCSAADLISQAAEIVNTSEIDFDNPQNTPTEYKNYREFAYYLEYDFPDALRFQSKAAYDLEVDAKGQVFNTLRMMGVNSEPDIADFSTLKEAVWNYAQARSQKTIEPGDDLAVTFLNAEIKRIEANYSEDNDIDRMSHDFLDSQVKLELSETGDKPSKITLSLKNGEKFEFEEKLGDYESRKENFDELWYGFEYRGRQYDMNIYRMNGDLIEGAPTVTFYPVRDGETDTSVMVSSDKVEIMEMEREIKLDYAFVDDSRGYTEGQRVTFYEEPRWNFTNNFEFMEVIAKEDPALFNKIKDYRKKMSEQIGETITYDDFYLDFGKSLRYDSEYANETLEDKLDDRFIVRYSMGDDDGNLGDGGDEIVMQDKALAARLNSMIKDHVAANIEAYKEFAKKEKIFDWLYEKHYDKNNFDFDMNGMHSDVANIAAVNFIENLSRQDLSEYDDATTLSEFISKEMKNEENPLLVVAEDTGELEPISDFAKELLHNNYLQKEIKDYAASLSQAQEEKLESQEKTLDPLTEPCKFEVDGLTRTCANGIQKGLEHAVMVINDLMETNKELVEENKQLEKQIRQLKRNAGNSY